MPRARQGATALHAQAGEQLRRGCRGQSKLQRAPVVMGGIVERQCREGMVARLSVCDECLRRHLASVEVARDVGLGCARLSGKRPRDPEQ